MNNEFFSSNFINNENNFEIDSNFRKMQENLIMMGFNLTMINKIISNFKIKTEDEALDYLIKSEDGMWHHPFIPKETSIEELNKSTTGIFKKPTFLMNSVLNRLKFNEISNSKERISKSVNVNQIIDKDFNELNNNNICEICGEEKEFHLIKNNSLKYNNSENNFSFKNRNNFQNYFKSNKNILIDDDEEEPKYENNNLINNNDSNSNNNNIYDIFNNYNGQNNNIMNDNNQNNNNNDNNLFENEEQEINLNKCPICMDEFENPLEMENCGHKFCFDCFHSYLINLININNIDNIPCPSKNCANKQLSEEFFSQYLSEREFFKYRQFKSQNLIARDSKKIFCPICDSYAQIDQGIEKYESNNPNYVKSVLRCMNGHKFCSCGRPLHENNCYKDENEFRELIKKEKIKKCPKCGFYINKNSGCNHMTCGNPTCKYEFCWICMNEAIPNHFDIGPCAGLQFIDPDGFQYWLLQNCRCCRYFFKFLEILLGISLIIIAFIVIPAFGLWFCFGFIINEILPGSLFSVVDKDFVWLFSAPIAISCQSIIYDIYILLYFMIIYFKYILIVIFSFIFILTIFIILRRLAFSSNNEVIEINLELENRVDG